MENLLVLGVPLLKHIRVLIRLTQINYFYTLLLFLRSTCKLQHSYFVGLNATGLDGKFLGISS